MTNRQERKKTQKQKKGLRITLIVLILVVLAVGGGGTIFLLNRLNTEAPTQTVQPDDVTLSATLTKTQTAAKNQQLYGEYQELEILTTDAVAQIFTYMPLSPETQYHGTEYVIPERRQDYLEFLKTTLYFYYKDLVAAYGENGLPVVANVEIADIYEDEFTDETTQETLVAYEVAVSWDYEANAATADENQQWANTGTFTWVYDENQSKWFLVDFTTKYDDTLPFTNAFVGNTDDTSDTPTDEIE